MVVNVFKSKILQILAVLLLRFFVCLLLVFFLLSIINYYLNFFFQKYYNSLADKARTVSRGKNRDKRSVVQGF